MFHRSDTIRLKKALPVYGLKTGDVGSIVHTHNGKQTADVAFIVPSGKPPVVLALRFTDIQPMTRISYSGYRLAEKRTQYEQFMGRASCPFCKWTSTRKTNIGRIHDFRNHFLFEHKDLDDDEIDYLIDQEKV